jgi:tetratricopeptide (TPR) repeat protein
MNTSEKQGRYDDAIQSGLKALRDTPRDAVVYEQIAMVYLARAGRDTNRERWTAEAATYFNKSVSVEPDNPVNLLDAARGFEIASGLTTNRRCSYFLRATDLSEALVHVVDSGHITIGGQRYSLDPVRKDFVAYGHSFRIEPLIVENAKLSERLRVAMTEGDCTRGETGNPRTRNSAQLSRWATNTTRPPTGKP